MTHDCKTDERGQITHLFFANSGSLDLLKAFPDVLLMDCTYKTNLYGMPLLVICGVTNLKTYQRQKYGARPTKSPICQPPR